MTSRQSLPSHTQSRPSLNLVVHRLLSLICFRHPHSPEAHITHSIPSLTHTRRSLTPIAHSHPSLTHSRRSLTPIAHSIPSLTHSLLFRLHSHRALTPVALSLPSRSHSRRALTLVALSLPSSTHVAGTCHPHAPYTTQSHMSLSHPSSSPSLLLSSLASSFPYAMLPLPDAMLPLSYAMLPLPYAMQPFPYALLPLPYRCSPFPTRCSPFPTRCFPFPTRCSPFPTRHTRLAHTCSHHPSPPFPFLSSLPFPRCPPPSLPCLRLASPPTHPHSLQSRIRSCRSLPSRPSFPSPVLVVRPSFASLTRSVAHSPHRSNEGTVHTGQPPCIGPVAHTLTCDIHSRSTHSLLSAPLSFPMSFPPFPLLPLPPLSRVLPSVSHLVPPSTSPCLSLRSPPCSSLSLSLSPFPTFPLPPFPPFLTAPTLPSFSSLVFSVLLISALIPTPHPSPSPTHVACTYHLHLPSSHLPSSHLPLLLLSLPSVPRTSLPPSLRPSLTEPSPPCSPPLFAFFSFHLSSLPCPLLHALHISLYPTPLFPLPFPSRCPYPLACSNSRVFSSCARLTPHEKDVQRHNSPSAVVNWKSDNGHEMDYIFFH